MELLAPAGSPEKLRYAIHYGADAVYCGIPDTSMRSRINAFTQESLREAADFDFFLLFHMGMRFLDYAPIYLFIPVQSIKNPAWPAGGAGFPISKLDGLFGRRRRHYLMDDFHELGGRVVGFDEIFVRPKS